ncbi:MAG: AzlD domain-containing protein [Elioraea sp.]|nr:AzlD domain-containing protein [Elioraea sp.]
MNLDPFSLAAILAMAGVTFAARASGYLLLRRLRPSPFLRAFLEHLPGTLFVAFVTPALVREGWAGVIGGAATLLVMRASASSPLALFSGVAAFWVARAGGL